MNDWSLAPTSPRRSPIVPVLAAVGVGLVALLVVGTVVSAAFTLAALLLPLLLLVAGVHFLGERRTVLGWALVVLGGVLLLGRLPLLLLLAGAAVVGWMVARRDP
jgi:hypothetical protein